MDAKKDELRGAQITSNAEKGNVLRLFDGRGGGEEGVGRGVTTKGT